MIIGSIAAPAFAALLVVGPLARAPQENPSVIESAFQRLDQNDDGFVTRTEYREARTIWPASDPAGQDPATYGARFGQIAGVALSYEGTAPVVQVLTKLPADDPCRAELVAAAGLHAIAKFNAFDVDENGKISFAEHQGAILRAQREKFARMDANGDGVVTLSELQKKRDDVSPQDISRSRIRSAPMPACQKLAASLPALPPEKPSATPDSKLRVLSALDRNGDSQLSFAEYFVH